MTAAIDRFLYRATADRVAERIADAYVELENALGDLESILDEKPKKNEILQRVGYVVERKHFLYEALDAAEQHVEDFVEANRP